MADLRKQVEELLAWSEEANKTRFYSACELVATFPAIARHYLALLDENAALRGALKGIADTAPGLFPHPQWDPVWEMRTAAHAALARADALTGEKPVKENQ